MFYKRNVLFFLPPSLPTLSNILLHSCCLCILPSSKSPRPWDLLSHSILLQPSCAVYPQILSNVSLECVWESVPPLCGLYLGLNNRLLLDYCHSFLITFPGIIGNDDNNDNFNINTYYLLISVCSARHCNNVLYEDYLIWFSQQPDEVYITIHILETKTSVAQRGCITCLWPHR